MSEKGDVPPDKTPKGKKKESKAVVGEMRVPVKLERGMAVATVGSRCGVNVEFEDRTP